jgi:hypothetical protein
VAALDHVVLGLADGGENVGLAPVVTVGTNTCFTVRMSVELSIVRRRRRAVRTEVDLLAVGVSLEGFGDTCAMCCQQVETAIRLSFLKLLTKNGLTNNKINCE